jgi:hypothetical protein
MQNLIHFTHSHHSEFSRSTKVEIISDNYGFYLCKQGTTAVIDMIFDDQDEAKQYAINEQYKLIDPV